MLVEIGVYPVVLKVLVRRLTGLGCGVGWRGGAEGSVELELVTRMVDFGRRWEIFFVGL